MSDLQSNGKMNGDVEKIVNDPDFNGNSSILPHLETWEKMMKIPVFESVVHQSEDVYQRVKCELKNLSKFTLFNESDSCEIRNYGKSRKLKIQFFIQNPKLLQLYNLLNPVKLYLYLLYGEQSSRVVSSFVFLFTISTLSVDKMTRFHW